MPTYSQTTDTLKRHQQHSISDHCGWPSLWIWGSATHDGLPACPEPLLRTRGLQKHLAKSKQQSHLTLLSDLVTTPIWHSRDYLYISFVLDLRHW